VRNDDEYIHALGLRLLPKIKNDHINLGPRLRMRVNLAAQVLSSSVAHALELQDNYQTKETRTFVKNFDMFFDCLNVSTLFQARRSRKDTKAPYETVDDWRFKWLKDVFLKGYIETWLQESMAVDLPTKDEKRRLCLSHQTIEGIKLTVNSFCELAPLLLSLDGVQYFLSEKLSQDPLEEYFNKQRSRCGAHDNPTLDDASRNFLAIDVAGSTLVRSMTGNTRGAQRGQAPIFDINDRRSLPRRRKRRHSE